MILSGDQSMAMFVHLAPESRAALIRRNDESIIGIYCRIAHSLPVWVGHEWITRMAKLFRESFGRNLFDKRARSTDAHQSRFRNTTGSVARRDHSASIAGLSAH